MLLDFLPDLDDESILFYFIDPSCDVAGESILEIRGSYLFFGVSCYWNIRPI